MRQDGRQADRSEKIGPEPSASVPDRVPRGACGRFGVAASRIGTVEEPADFLRRLPMRGGRSLSGPTPLFSNCRASDASAAAGTARTRGSAASSPARPVSRVTTSHCTALATSPWRPPFGALSQVFLTSAATTSSKPGSLRVQGVELDQMRGALGVEQAAHGEVRGGHGGGDRVEEAGPSFPVNRSAVPSGRLNAWGG